MRNVSHKLRQVRSLLFLAGLSVVKINSKTTTKSAHFNKGIIIVGDSLS
jgi:hypothetical protein